VAVDYCMTLFACTSTCRNIRRFALRTGGDWAAERASGYGRTLPNLVVVQLARLQPLTNRAMRP